MNIFKILVMTAGVGIYPIPEFQTTAYREGIEKIRNEQTLIKKNQ